MTAMYKPHEHEMEIGNLLFGDSRGWYPVDRGKYQDLFSEFLTTADFNEYGFYNGSDKNHITARGGYENDTFVINPYYWGDHDEEAEKPNFIYKPTGFKIKWYKYPLRDSYSNQCMDEDTFEDIINHCLESVVVIKKNYELMITVEGNPASWIYFKTFHSHIKDAFADFQDVCEKNGINIDNVNIRSLELRDDDGAVLGSR